MTYNSTIPICSAMNGALLFVQTANFFISGQYVDLPWETTISFCVTQLLAQIPLAIMCSLTIDWRPLSVILVKFVYHLLLISGSFWSTIIAYDMRRIFLKSISRIRNSNEDQRNICRLFFVVNILLTVLFSGLYCVHEYVYFQHDHTTTATTTTTTTIIITTTTTNSTNTTDNNNGTTAVPNSTSYPCYVLVDQNQRPLCWISLALPLISVTLLNLVVLIDCCIRMICHRFRQPALHKFRLTYMKLYGPIVLFTALRNVTFVFINYGNIIDHTLLYVVPYLLSDTLIAVHILIGFTCHAGLINTFGKMYRENDLILNYSYSRYRRRHRNNNQNNNTTNNMISTKTINASSSADCGQSGSYSLLQQTDRHHQPIDSGGEDENDLQTRL